MNNENSQENNTLTQTINGITCEYRSARGLELVLSAADGGKMRVLPLDMGTGLAEGKGIIKYCRHHSREDGFSFGFKTKVVIPFGVEPEIKREIELAGNHASVTVDVQLKSGIELKSLLIDPVIIAGPFKRIGIVNYPGEDGITQAIDWKTPSAEAEESLYNSSRPFLCCVAETEAGQRWEIGTGDDLWRWQCAKKYQAAAEFRILRAGNELRIEREVYRRKENAVAPDHNLRFHWYFAWDDGKTAAPKKASGKAALLPLGSLPEEKELKTTHFDWIGSDLPFNSMFAPTPENNGNAPCALAHPVIKRYKNWIRTATAKYNRQVLKVAGVSAHYCCVAAHLERNNKPVLQHWDMMAIFTLWDWGNRQMAKHGNSIIFLSANDTVFRELPSHVGLAQPPPPLR